MKFFGKKREEEKEEKASGARMTKDRINKAVSELSKYRQGKTALEGRIIENEQFFKLRHWDKIKSANTGDPEPTSAWLLNCIMNKHADAMDNSPAPRVLPREEGDKKDAETLSSILPVIMEQNEFDRINSDMWWYKLKTGTGVFGVFWNPEKENGLGDVEIKSIDMLNLFWQPGIKNIQDSRNLFYVDLIDEDLLKERFPGINSATLGRAFEVKEYIHDESIDTSGKAAVVDWYYKTESGGRTVLHYCKFAGENILYSSEDDPTYAERGFYDHGKYPFVTDPLFVLGDSFVGFGYIDICKDPQLYIDKLNQVILKNAVMAARPRFFVRADGNINENEYADWTRDFVHFNGSGNPNDSIIPIRINALSGSYISVLNGKIEEMKETSGNRDFSQGGTNSGVTAAAAIAALQEAGNKLSRDMIKSSYRAFKEVCYIVIELIRQFYDEERCFRVRGTEGAESFVKYSNERLKPQKQTDDFGQDMGYRRPIFDVVVTAEKANSFSSLAENERAKELYGLGFFNPEMADQALAALEMMDFERIDAVKQRIAENRKMHQMIQELQSQVLSLSQMVSMRGEMPYVQENAEAHTGGRSFNPIMAAVNSAQNTTSNAVKDRVQNVASPM